MAVTFVAPPAAGAGTPQAPRPKTIAMSAEAKVAASASHAMAVAPTAAPVQETADAAGTEHKPFFKTGKGIAALVLMVGATSWLVISRTSSNDVVHSPGRN
jgi:hypothetical protein